MEANAPRRRAGQSTLGIRAKYALKSCLSIVLLLCDWIPVIGVKPETHAKRRVLVVRIDLIGDFVLWLPAARALRALYPREQWHVTLAANAVWADLATKQTIFDEVWPIDARRLVTNPGYRYRMLRRARTAGFDVAIEPTYSRERLRGDALIRASAAAERIGSQGDCSNTGPWLKRVTDRWYTRLVRADPVPMTELRRNAEFVSGLGGADGVEMPKLHVESGAAPPELNGVDYFVLFPGASMPGKQWPIERFGEIAQRVIRENGWHGIVCGGAADMSLAERLCRISSVPLRNLAGTTSLEQLAAILARARLVLTNDTSAAHIAPAVGAPTVCILGGGHYGRFLPYDLPEAAQISRTVDHRMDCYGCNWRCIYRVRRNDPFPCVEQVPVAKVWTSILEVLGAAGGAVPRCASVPGVAKYHRD